jgi:hypothetical protein
MTLMIINIFFSLSLSHNVNEKLVRGVNMNTKKSESEELKH